MRLFAAVELSDAMKASLKEMQRSLAQFDAAVRWTVEGQMHLTLKFFGEVSDSRVAEICSAAGAIADDSAAFGMTLDGCGCFPPSGPARIVWAGLHVSGDGLEACHRACEEHFGDLGFEPDRRRFTPHLTIGRVRERRRADGLREAIVAVAPAPVSQHVDALSVFQSTLAPRGAQHTVISRHALRGASPSSP